MREWYRAVLSADIVHDNPMISFISYDDEHHRVAFLDPGPLAQREGAGEDPLSAGTQAGLHHVAFTFASLGDLMETYERVKDIGITPYWCINHGPTTSMYYRDPDGNRVELQVDAFPTCATARPICKARISRGTRWASSSSPTSFSRAFAPACRSPSCCGGTRRQRVKASPFWSRIDLDAVGTALEQAIFELDWLEAADHVERRDHQEERHGKPGEAHRAPRILFLAAFAPRRHRRALPTLSITLHLQYDLAAGPGGLHQVIAANAVGERQHEADMGLHRAALGEIGDAVEDRPVARMVERRISIPGGGCSVGAGRRRA